MIKKHRFYLFFRRPSSYFLWETFCQNCVYIPLHFTPTCISMARTLDRCSSQSFSLCNSLNCSPKHTDILTYKIVPDNLFLTHLNLHSLLTKQSLKSYKDLKILITQSSGVANLNFITTIFTVIKPHNLQIYFFLPLSEYVNCYKQSSYFLLTSLFLTLEDYAIHDIYQECHVS